jgi:hypothetical protein
MAEKDFGAYLKEMLPQPEDVRLVGEIEALERQWISAKGAIQ